MTFRASKTGLSPQRVTDRSMAVPQLQFGFVRASVLSFVAFLFHCLLPFLPSFGASGGLYFVFLAFVKYIHVLFLNILINKLSSFSSCFIMKMACAYGSRQEECKHKCLSYYSSKISLKNSLEADRVTVKMLYLAQWLRSIHFTWVKVNIMRANSV